MENPEANQLPEVDSLPDGFVESPPEPLAPPTPTFEQEKPLDNREDDIASDIDRSKEPVEELAADEFQTSQGRTEKTQKLRTFPVPLSETDSSDVSVESVQVPKRASTEQTEEGGTLVMPDSADSVSETSAGVPECSEVKEQVEARCQSSERPTEGGSDASAANVKETSSLESVETLKSKKTESTETKRKSAKRTFKSEKEFIEFTLKYQQVLAERDSAISVRDKLESLCRELQRQNKVLMDECKRVSTEGQNLRLDLSVKFQDAIKDVSNKLDEQKEECISQLKENEMLRTKLQQLTYQYALSEQQYEQKLKQKSLELQIADLKIKQHEEKLIQEQSQMKLYAEQVSQLLSTEKNLRLQLTADGEKFQQFQDALLKSNEVFETFKQEIEKMAKSIKELKKENLFLKSKCEKTDVTLIELVDERERLKKQLEKTKNQKEKLESLCRSLQAERKQNSIGSNNSDSVPS
ncbi:PREDICTED: alpha-taxilin [Prunus dulcis]|uniref:PREDICTED: alpha-taxilin n=1 Tax=Prunus dulcis TaxID=3755 RepID=A0A5E4E9A5_PRUDU|nr:alpha-taxilin isoform X1 [Prunus dulcis]XP_034204197.1 alpha-taxilin isoform X1 [Prunus dulcis]XP_034204199.1 alpha-taxilin isoform X1 [Prunus dulcis]VVA12275.1 PREDICTED: alpha-taxilin [Prunus dulcis]